MAREKAGSERRLGVTRLHFQSGRDAHRVGIGYGAPRRRVHFALYNHPPSPNTSTCECGLKLLVYGALSY